MNSRAHTSLRKFLLVLVALAAPAALAAAVALANDTPQASPNPVTFSGAGFQEVTIHNPGSATAQWDISISAGASAFASRAAPAAVSTSTPARLAGCASSTAQAA